MNLHPPTATNSGSISFALQNSPSKPSTSLDSALDPNPNASYDENDLEFLGDSVVRRLEFANNEVGQIVEEKDVAKAVRWIEVLRRVEDERIEWIA